MIKDILLIYINFIYLLFILFTKKFIKLKIILVILFYTVDSYIQVKNKYKNNSLIIHHILSLISIFNLYYINDLFYILKNMRLVLITNIFFNLSHLLYKKNDKHPIYIVSFIIYNFIWILLKNILPTIILIFHIKKIDSYQISNNLKFITIMNILFLLFYMYRESYKITKISIYIINEYFKDRKKKAIKKKDKKVH